MDFINMIGSVGFPIVACLYMAKMYENEHETRQAEMQRITQALNDNTAVLIELKTLFESMRGKRH